LARSCWKRSCASSGRACAAPPASSIAAPAASIASRLVLVMGCLLHAHVVGDGAHTVHALRDLHGAVDVGAARNEAAQLDAALEGLDVDLRRLERRLIEDRGLDGGGDGGVVDVLAGAFVLLGGSAAGQGGEGDGGD